MIGTRRLLIIFCILLASLLFCLLAFNNLKIVFGGLDTNIGELVSHNDEEAISGLSATRAQGSVFFLGDIQLGRDVERRLLKEGSDYPYRKLSLWDNYDFVIANFESSVPELHIPTKDNTFRFSTREDFLPSLRVAGITHASLANNHAFDHGLEGYNHTLTALTNSDIKAFGHPSLVSSSSVIYIDNNGLKIAVIGIHTLYQYPDSNELAVLMDAVSSQSDFQIAYIHWGEEYQAFPSKIIRQYASDLVGLGFDVVIGHHPHVIQTIEKINGVPVFYSLGNFIFDQYFSKAVQNGLVLELIASDIGLGLALHPVSSIESRNQPEVLTAEARLEALEYISTISEADLTSEIKSGFILLN